MAQVAQALTEKVAGANDPRHPAGPDVLDPPAPARCWRRWPARR
ncbi:hypothetical protein ACRAWD_15700 [Caulobacter segnis]